jgi:SAM-dependent methyltransferase
MLPLSKTLDPADFAQLSKELAIVDAHFTDEREQHPMRRWEYALALDALWRWRTQSHREAAVIYDVGGAGSPFRWMSDGVQVVDPDSAGGITQHPYELRNFVTQGTELAAAVFCLSVLEHVDDLDQFLYQLGCLVAPGGLLFLTMDCCGDPGHQIACRRDDHHFHWMRKRIFTLSHWEYLSLNLKPYGFELFGEADWTFHGPQVYDYTFASLALIKRS